MHIELDTVQEDPAVDEDTSLDSLNAPFSEPEVNSSSNTSDSSHDFRSLDQSRTQSPHEIGDAHFQGWTTTTSADSQGSPASPSTDDDLPREMHRYCSVIAEQPDFLFLRRFKILSARVLLSLQKNLMAHEDALAKLDLRSASDPRGFDGEYADAMASSYGALMEYYALIQHVSEVTERPNAHAEHIHSLKLAGARCLRPEELRYLNYRLDLFALVPKFKNPLRKVLEKYNWHHWRLWRIRDRRAAGGHDLESGALKKVEIDDRLVDRVIKFITMTIGLVMLIGPIWILEFIRRRTLKLSVISAFVVLFSYMMAYATVGKPGDSLLAAAAYAAVLMVFLQLESPT